MLGIFSSWAPFTIIVDINIVFINSIYYFVILKNLGTIAMVTSTGNHSRNW